MQVSAQKKPSDCYESLAVVSLPSICGAIYTPMQLPICLVLFIVEMKKFQHKKLKAASN